MRKLLPLILAVSMTVAGLAQTGKQTITALDVLKTRFPNATHEQCKTDVIHQKLLQSDSNYAKTMQLNELKIQDYIRNNQNQLRSSAVYTIPVVVHVIHLGESVGNGTNISDAQIQSAIDNLNDAYSNNGYNGLDIGIQFTLAKRDDECNASTGIVRIDGTSITGYSTDGITSSNETSVKALSKWDNYTYYNIWIVSEIDGNNGGSGTQGYAYFPGASADYDGAVILYNAFGYDPNGSLGYELKPYTNYNVTAIHEIGHGLNLYHTFQGDDADSDGTADQCPVDSNPSADGDLCSDTDAHRRDDSDCDVIQQTCHGVSNSEVFNNFMAYSSDECQDRFTADQKVRMLAALLSTRVGLTNSLGGTAPNETGPITATCSVDYTTPNSFGMGVTDFEFNSIHVASRTSQYDGGYQDRTCYFKTELVTGDTYPINIDGGTANNQDVEVWIDYNNDGDFDDANENVFSGSNGTTFSGNVVVPTSGVILDTYLRMRVTVDWFNNTISGSCYNPQYGEVEEYSVMVSSNCLEPDQPVVSYPGGTTCAGSTVTLTITGDLNDADHWAIYSGSCGGTLLGTTQSSSYLVAPGSSSTTYFVRGEGGCATATSCGQVQVVVTTNDDASFSYSSGTYCTTDSDPSPTITGTAGGTFSSTAGLSLNSSSGVIDLSASSSGTYNITYETSGSCSAQSSVDVEVQNCVVVPNTKLRWNDCGVIVSTFSQNIYSTLVLGATQYEFLFIPQGGGAASSIIRSSRDVTLAKLGLFAFNETYDVQVRAYIGSNVGSYSTVCQISSPTGVPKAQLRPEDCGITLSSFSQVFYASYVAGATSFDFEFTPQGGGTITTVTSTGRDMTLIEAGLMTFGVTYDVRVRGRIGSDVGIYNTVCTLTSPAGVPNAKLRAEDCGLVLSSYGQKIYSSYVGGATQYEFQFTPQGGGTPISVVKPNREITLSQAGISTSNQVYDVQVRAYIGTEIGTYGNVCQITTPGAAAMTINDDITSTYEKVYIDEFGYINNNALENVNVYPNPFLDNLTINFGQLLEGVEVSIYNSIGQIVHKEKSSDVQIELQLSELEVGVYLMQLQVGDETKMIRIVKN
ncbi:MAG: T9SS type A sorting domain-containing protein [Flavobacteriales bacterium]|nr:T9SS type A sorting domain-containing protein [Flavobacteriales bacterium]